RRLDQTRRPRSGAKGCQPGHDPRQVREMIVGPRRTFERDAEKLHPIRRKAGWKYGVALDDARIAVRGALARPRAVDQRDPEAALGEMNGDRGADNAGAEHDDIGMGHGTPLRLPTIVCARARPATRPACETTATLRVARSSLAC